MSTEQLVQTGAVGIAIALIAVVFFIVKWFCNFISVHLDRNTDALLQNTKVTSELRVFVRELGSYLKAKNGSLKT